MQSRYFLSLIDQGMLSVFSFVLSLVLIRTWGADVFGVFALCQGVAFFCVGIQNAFVNTPLNVFVPACQTIQEKAQTERVLSSVNFILIISVFALVTIFIFFFPMEARGSLTFSLVIAVFVAGMLLREYARAVGFGRQRPIRVLRIDSLYLLIGCGIFVVYGIDPERLDLVLAIALIAIASAVSGTAGLLMEEGRSVTSIKGFSPRAYKPIWKESKWALFGVITYELQARGFIYLVVGLAGFNALGILVAGQMLFRPVGLLFTAWARVALPQLAEAMANQQRSTILKILKVSGTVGFIGTLSICGLIYAVWEPLQSYVYGGRYEGIGFVVAGWAVVTLAATGRPIMIIALQSMKKFKPLAFTTFYGSIVSLAALAVIIPIFGYRMTFLGILAGQLVSGFLTIIFFLREFKAIGKTERKAV